MKATSIAACLLFTAANFARALTITNAPVSHIVTLKPGADPQAVVAECGLHCGHVFRHAFKGFAAVMDDAVVEQLKHDPRVAAVEGDGNVVLCEQTNSTGILRLNLTNFPVALINGLDERIDVDVAVLDTGIDPHPDLNVYVREAFNGRDPNIDTSTDSHGTHVAGIVGALDNDFGVVGVAPGVRLWSLTVSSPGPGGAAWSGVLAGFDYVTAHADEIEVANCSFVSDGSVGTPIAAIQQAVSNMVSAGVVVVGAAGNTGIDVSGNDFVFGTYDDYYPAALPEVMAVGLMDPVNNNIPGGNFSYVARSNNFVISPGLALDVAAPGMNILSTTTNGGYGLLTGTSMSAPHAAGVVALYIAANGRATNAAGVYQIRQAIVDNSLPQSEWNFFGEPDGNPEPLVYPNENWVPAPRITSQAMSASGFDLSFTTVPGYRYTAESADSLSPSNLWADFAITNGTGSIALVTDTNHAPDLRVYRVRREPASEP